jgi:N-acyl-D-amino-acid deacylase
MMADIALFDAAAIQDLATYEDPLRYSAGVKDVFVNGRPVVLDGKITADRPGRALRGPGYRLVQ